MIKKKRIAAISDVFDDEYVCPKHYRTNLEGPSHKRFATLLEYTFSIGRTGREFSDLPLQRRKFEQLSRVGSQYNGRMDHRSNRQSAT